MNDEKFRIILLTDIKEKRQRQLKELAMYLKKKEELEKRLEYIRRDLQLTETIIKMIQKENSANNLDIR